MHGMIRYQLFVITRRLPHSAWPQELCYNDCPQKVCFTLNEKGETEETKRKKQNERKEMRLLRSIITTFCYIKINVNNTL